MSLHKLTAGDGYTYLTRQVAAHDATERGYDNLGAYYAQKGESLGVWMGRGLAGVPDLLDNALVSEAQMVALFGEGRVIHGGSGAWPPAATRGPAPSRGATVLEVSRQSTVRASRNPAARAGR